MFLTTGYMFRYALKWITLSRDMYRIECTIVFIMLLYRKKNDLVDTVRFRAAGDHPLICEAVLIHSISFQLQKQSIVSLSYFGVY